MSMPGPEQFGVRLAHEVKELVIGEGVAGHDPAGYLRNHPGAAPPLPLLALRRSPDHVGGIEDVDLERSRRGASGDPRLRDRSKRSHLIFAEGTQVYG